MIASLIASLLAFETPSDSKSPEPSVEDLERKNF